MKNPEQTIGNIADKQKTAYLGSVDHDGFPNIKAMLQPRKREGIKTFYFSTNTSSMRVSQYKENERACVYFCDRRFFRGVMLRGTMEILTDLPIKKRYGRKVIQYIILTESPTLIIVYCGSQHYPADITATSIQRNLPYKRS